MLLQLAVENFKSIQQKIIFSMLATKEDLHNEYKRSISEYHVLPSAILMGTNGAGKSNLFLAVSYLQQLLKENNGEIKFYPHLLNEEKLPTQIDIQFLVDDVRMMYGADILENQVVGEFLYTFDKNQQVVIFEREFNQYQFNPSYEAILSELKDTYGKDNLLFFPIINQYTDIPIINHAYQFLTEDVVVILSDMHEDNRLLLDAIHSFKEKENHTSVNTLLRKINIGITGFNIRNNEILVKYDNMEINLLDESKGTKKLFTLLVLLTDALNDGKVVLFDELESNLHLAFTQYFVHTFNEKETNPNNGQLLFSAHQTSLLNLSHFRRDQVWFMEKNLETMATECYSLYNIKDVRQNEDIEKGYLLGKYGATYHFKHGGVSKNEK